MGKYVSVSEINVPQKPKKLKFSKPKAVRMMPFGAQSYEKDAFLLPVENMRDFIIPPLANTVWYSSSAAFRHEEYVVLIRESTADSHMRMMDALQAVRQVSPNLEDWLTHDFSFEQAADGALHVQNHKEVEPELIPNI